MQRKIETEQIMQDAARRQEAKKNSMRLDEIDQSNAQIEKLLREQNAMLQKLESKHGVTDVSISRQEYDDLIAKCNSLSGRLWSALKGKEIAEKEADRLFDKASETSNALAQFQFPMILDPKHPINATAREIWRKAEEARDPVIYDPGAPLIIYNEAAKRLGITAKSP